MTAKEHRLGLAAVLVLLGCSDGAQPEAYRPALEGAPPGAPKRCDAPTTCFESCYCAGQTVEDCSADCLVGGGAGGALAAGGAAVLSGSPSHGAGGSPVNVPQAGAGGSPAVPPPAACTPVLPDSSSAEYSCHPEGGLACNNCEDCRQIIDGSAKAAASDCGVQCGGSRQCAASCLATSTTLSGGCSSCLLDFFECIVQNCLANCLGTTPDACTACARTRPTEAASCSTALERCSGAHARVGGS